jgi:carbon storage regulator
MLVVTRRKGEAIVVGDGIEVVVLRSGRDGVRLGVRAPASVTVHRKEIYDVILEENRKAAQLLGAPGEAEGRA